LIERISTGIQGFDELIEGGLPKGSITLIAGTPGTGKSIFCAQILYNNAIKGKRCLYLNLEQDNGRLENQMQQFGWNLNKVKNNLTIISISPSDINLLDFVLKETQKNKYELIAIDSLDSISETLTEIEETNKLSMEKIVETVVPTMLDTKTIGRLKLKKIFNAISKTGATALLIAERIEGQEGITRDTISEFMCDGIIVMYYLGVGALDFRSMKIIKLRMTNHFKDYILFNITQKGIEIMEDPLKKKN